MGKLALDASLGAMMIGTWVNAMLYMLEIVQISRLLRNHPNDRPGLRAMVGASFLIDTLCTVAACATVYIYCVSDWGDVEGLATQYWTFPTYVICTAASAAIVQSFLIYRYYILSRRNIATGVFAALALAAAAGGAWLMFALILFPAFAQRHLVALPAALWLCATTVTDIVLASALVWQLRTVKSSFKQINTVLSKLMTTAIQSGSITSVIAIAVLITFLINNESNIPVMINFCLGRVYTHTMLYGLNLRGRLQTGSKGDVHTSGDITNHSSGPAINLTGIQVQRSVQVEDGTAPSPLGKAASTRYYTASYDEHRDKKYNHGSALGP